MGTAIYRSLHTPGPRNPQKVPKGLPGPPRPECQKSVEKVPKDPKKRQKVSKSVFGDFFDTFFDTSSGEAREDLLETFWGFRPRGVETPVYGGSHRNSRQRRSLRSPDHGRVFTEATIKTNSLGERSGAHPNGKIYMFLATIADGKTAALWGEGKKNCKNSP